MLPEPSRFERFRSRFSRSKRRNAAEAPPTTPALTVPIIAPATASPLSTENGSSLAIVSSTANIDDTPSTASPETRDLWSEALEKLPKKLQADLEVKGLKKGGAESFASQVKALQEEAKLQQARSEERDWKVPLGGREIPVRQLTVNIKKWAIEIGGLAIAFAPSPGAGIWSVITYLLQGIDTFDTEKTALLSVIDKVAGALFRAQTYYAIYTIERTKETEVVKKLHDALVDLYSCVLELLVKSSDLSSNTAVQFCHAIFDTKRPSALLSNLEQCGQALQAAAELCEVTANARQDGDLREYLKKAQAFLENFGDYMAVVNNRERENLLEWVSTVQYGRHFDDIEEKRSPGTGGWLTEHPLFQEWIDSPLSSVLWLQGYPGTGKTYLTSSVVSHIMNEMQPQKDGLAYFFCNHDERDRSETLSVLKSLIRQLAAPKSNSDAVRKSLQEARTRAIDAGTHFNLSECRNQLQESLNLYSTTVIILDALDEVLSDELSILIEELGYLMSQNRVTRVKLFISSRPEEEIQMVYKSGPTITIQASDNRADIEQFLDKKLTDIEKTKLNSPVNQMRRKIVEKILDNCGNVFLWVDLQLKQIQRCKSAEAIEYELENLPKGLSQRYDRIMSQIDENPLLDAQMAKRALKWVLSAPEPLETEEITSAVRINIENDSTDLKNEMSPESLLAICENLLMIDSKGQWRFFHLSVREYLKENQEFKHKSHLFCAQVCFLSLMKTFGSSFSSSEPHESSQSLVTGQATTSPFDPTSRFSHHLQHCWPFYASSLDRNDEPFVLLRKFLGSPNESSISFVRWSNHLFEQDSRKYKPIRLHVGLSKTLIVSGQEIFPNTTPLFAIVRFSLHKAFCEIYKDEDSQVLLRNERGETLFSMAREAGCLQICEVLLLKLLSIDKRNADVEIAAAITTATAYGQIDFVKWLVKEGHANVNLLLQSGHYGSTLAAAAQAGDLEIVQYLVEKARADVDLPLQSGHDGSALAAAAQAGDLEIVRYLVEKAHADVDLPLQSGDYGSALAAAAYMGELEIVRYLVEEAHADVDLPLQSGDYGSALAAAARGGELEIVQYLVEKARADVDLPLQSGNYGSALAAAAAAATWGGELKVVRYLVEKAHADVDLPLQSGDYGSALAAAACGGELELVRYLVEKAHADVNLPLQSGHYGSALTAAATWGGGLEVMRYLVEKAHADVDLPLQSGDYGSALAAAACGGELEIAQYLVEEAHADVDLPLLSGDYGSALAAAAANYRGMEVVRYLVEEAHADVNLPLLSGDHGSALAAAAKRGILDIVRYLVEECQAELMLLLPDGSHADALAAARLIEDNEDVVRYLEQKADYATKMS